ncbi:MAG: hypothetical protein LKF61_05995, partial [Eggerthellaceae bacterium]|nr:hypothetical protein [Eggerthellaceae bacterium]
VRGADGYGFCYDGYLETDEGQHDALIVEGGTPGGEQGYAIGRLYTPAEQEGEQPVFEDEVVYVGAAPNFMEFTLTENDTDADNPSADDSDAEEADASDENHDAAPTDPQEA